jgi:hypothetical protein
MFYKVALLTAIAAAWAVPAAAQSPVPPLPFPPLPMPQGTPEERAACAPDVHRFCEAAHQDTMRVLACLQANRPKIGAGCNRVHGH